MLNEKKETHNTLYEYEFHDFYTKKGALLQKMTKTQSLGWIRFFILWIFILIPTLYLPG